MPEVINRKLASNVRHSASYCEGCRQVSRLVKVSHCTFPLALSGNQIIPPVLLQLVQEPRETHYVNHVGHRGILSQPKDNRKRKVKKKMTYLQIVADWTFVFQLIDKVRSKL